LTNAAKYRGTSNQRSSSIVSKTSKNILDLSNVNFNLKNSQKLTKISANRTRQAPPQQVQAPQMGRRISVLSKGFVPKRSSSENVNLRSSLVQPKNTPIPSSLISTRRIHRNSKLRKTGTFTKTTINSGKAHQRSVSLGAYIPRSGETLKRSTINIYTGSTKTKSNRTFVNLDLHSGRTEKMRQSGVRYSVSKFSDRDLSPKIHGPNVKVYRANVLTQSREGSIKRSQVMGTPHFNLVNSQIQRDRSSS
jgi:hypothetical protein